MKDNVVGHPGYHVTKNGEIYSYSRGAWKLRKTSNTSSTGRIRVKIGTKWLQVSRLVALAWVHNPKPEIYDIVMHLDNDPSNNHYKNLKWGTYKENTQQMMMEGRNRGQFKPTITKQQISLILEKYATGKYSQIQLARLVGLKSQGRISRIINKYSSVGLE